MGIREGARMGQPVERPARPRQPSLERSQRLGQLLAGLWRRVFGGRECLLEPVGLRQRRSVSPRSVPISGHLFPGTISRGTRCARGNTDPYQCGGCYLPAIGRSCTTVVSISRSLSLGQPRPRGRSTQWPTSSVSSSRSHGHAILRSRQCGPASSGTIRAIRGMEFHSAETG